MTRSGTTMKSSLEALPNIGTVEVQRGVPTPEDGYTWTVTFTANPGAFPVGSGKVPDLIPHFAGSLTAQSANVTVAEDTAGSIPACRHVPAHVRRHGSQPKDDRCDPLGRAGCCRQGRAGTIAQHGPGERDAARGTPTASRGKVTFNGCKTIGLESERNICNYGNIRQLTGDASMLVGGMSAGPSVIVDTVLNGTTGTAQTVSDLSGGPPFSYDIEKLVTGTKYYVRVSARNQCPFVCPGCCAYGARQVPSPNLFSVPDRPKAGRAAGARPRREHRHISDPRHAIADRVLGTSHRNRWQPRDGLPSVHG